MIKNIITDLGNVVVEFNPLKLALEYVEDMDRAIEVADAIFNTHQWYLWDKNDTTKENIAAFAKDKLHPDEWTTVDEILHSWWEHLELNPEILEYYKEEREKGKKIFILSNYSTDYYKTDFSKKHGHIFHGEIISCDYHLCKPDPKIFEILMEKYGIKPEESIFIDDLDKNIATAREIGFHAIKFHFRKNSLDELKDKIANNEELAREGQ